MSLGAVAVSPAVMATHTATVDTHDTVLVHRALRRELRLLPTLVRQASGDRERPARVRAHAEDVLALLHHHRAAEDRLVWPRLRARVALAPALVDRRQAQRDQVSALVADVVTGLAAWGGDPDHGRGLAGVLLLLHDALVAHLDEQERLVLPLVARTFTQREWDELGQSVLGAVPRGRRTATLGLVLKDADEAEQTAFLAQLPPASRLVYRLVGRRQHAREAATLRIPSPRGSQGGGR